MSTIKNNIRFIRLPEVIEMTTLPKSTIWEEIKKNNFPLPAKVTSRSRVWAEHEIIEWMNNKLEERDNTNK